MKMKIQDQWKWLSEDSCGAQYFSTNRPNLRDTGTWGGGGITTYSPIAFDLGPDYRDSLHQIIDGELVKPPTLAKHLWKQVKELATTEEIYEIITELESLTLKVDDKVWVTSSVVDGWVPRHYSGASSTPGNIWCFNNSQTSFTIGKGGTTEWAVWQRAIDGVDPNES